MRYQELSRLQRMAENEERVSALYRIYAEKFFSAGEVWSDLAAEEIQHAKDIHSIIEGVNNKEIAIAPHRFNAVAIEAFRRRIEETITQAPECTSLSAALENALEIESEFLEKAFFEVMESDSPLMRETFDLLRHATFRHRERIQNALREGKEASS
jgi:hypothetical protein